MLLLQQRFSLITTRVLYKLIQNGGTEPEAMSFRCILTLPLSYTALAPSPGCSWCDTLLCPSPGGRSACGEIASVKEDQKAPEFCLS